MDHDFYVPVTHAMFLRFLCNNACNTTGHYETSLLLLQKYARKINFANPRAREIREINFSAKISRYAQYIAGNFPMPWE